MEKYYHLVVIFTKVSIDKLNQYEVLFEKCFNTKKLTHKYLKWLYFENPLGPAVGYDAIDNGAVVAHYACIPIKIDNQLGLLALNNATHPEFRSKGIHQKLAKKTFTTYKLDYAFIIAVVNYYSLSNYVNKLGFVEIGRLNLRWGKLFRNTDGVKSWSTDEVNWRIKSPKSKISLKKDLRGNYYFVLKYFQLRLKSYANVKLGDSLSVKKFPNIPFGLTLDWNRNHRPLIKLPERLKPSPLVLILKSFGANQVVVNSWSFPDFDAF